MCFSSLIAPLHWPQVHVYCRCPVCWDLLHPFWVSWFQYAFIPKINHFQTAIVMQCHSTFSRFLDQIEDPTMFAFFCFLVRGMEALGAAAFGTAGFTFVAHLFPDNIGAVMVRMYWFWMDLCLFLSYPLELAYTVLQGVLEIFVGLGLSAGPAIGGALYSVSIDIMAFKIFTFLWCKGEQVWHILVTARGIFPTFPCPWNVPGPECAYQYDPSSSWK